MHTQITPQHQVYLDSALRDAVEHYGYAYKIDQTPMPAELRQLVMKKCGWKAADEISDSLLAEAAVNIWFDHKRAFRLTLLRSGLDPEQTEDLKLADLPPIKPLGSYTIQQNDSMVVTTCTNLNLTGNGDTLEAAIEDLYHSIRNEFFDDDYRPEEDPRNWAAAIDATPEQQAALRFLHADLYLTEEQKPRFKEAAAAGKPLPKDIARSFVRQLFQEENEE